MLAEEVQAIGRLAADALTGANALVADTHAGIAQRAFAHVPGAGPVRLIHDGVSRAVYAGVREAMRGAALGGAALAAGRVGVPDTSLAADPRRAMVLGALNGVYGDRVAARAPALALPMTVRRGGADVELTPGAVRAAFPDATSRVAVFVHGLCETELAWRRRRARSLGDRLQDELSYTPVFIRYNSGRAIADNGRELARLLSALCHCWPFGVEEIVLVGHGMGGVVCRHACSHGDLAWTDHVRHLFCLGAPRQAWESGIHAVSGALARLPETRALSDLLDARSAAIKDLRGRHSPSLTDAVEHCIDARGVPAVGLLSHPAVYELVRRAITAAPRRALAAGGPAS